MIVGSMLCCPSLGATMNSQAVTLPPQTEDEINLRDYWRVLVKRRVLIVCLTVGVAFATAFITLLQFDVYQSTVTLLPLTGSGAGLPTEAQQGLLSGLLGVVGVGSGSSSERLLAVLHSRTLTEDVIQRLDLLPILFAESWDTDTQRWVVDEPPNLEDAVRSLRSMVKITSDETNTTISLTVTSADPVLCAAIAAQYIEELQRILRDNAFSLAKKNRLFIEEQLQKTQEDLRLAEEALQSFEQKYQIVALDQQTIAAVQAITSVESQIMAKEVQLHVLRQAITGASQEVQLLQEELRALRAQLARLKYKTDTVIPSAEKVFQSDQELFLALDKAPEIKLQYARLQRDALLQNKLFAFLVEQREKVRLEEARDETSFQILDRAIPAHKRAKPNRVMSVLLATICSAFVGVFLAFFFEYVNTTIQTQEQVVRQVSLPLLATVPLNGRQKARSQRRQPQPRAQLEFPELPPDSTREALRYLRTRLKSLNGAGALQALLLTSAGEDEDVTTLLAYLALVVASMGERILMVDGNVYSPSLHTWFHCPPSPGLADLLGNNPGEWQKSVQSMNRDTLSLIPAGTLPRAVFPSVHSLALDTLLTEWKKAYDLILFVAPPVLTYADTALLSSKFDATCLVLTRGVSHAGAVREAHAMLESVKANVIGTVFAMS